MKTIIVFREARIFYPCFGYRKFYPCWTEAEDRECHYTYSALMERTIPIASGNCCGYDVING